MSADVSATTLERILRDAALPRNEAVLLAAFATGRERAWVLAHGDETLSSPWMDALLALLERRRRGEPIAYLVGAREFFGRRFAVNARVLIPRPETELLVERAIAWLSDRPMPRVLDLGTGSGVIAVTLALERTGSVVLATDRSVEALVVAEANAARLGAPVRFVAGDWYAALAGQPPFDLIVSNPPYIPSRDRHLDEGDLRFEPTVALTDGHDGLAAIRCIVAGAIARLEHDGMLMLEHGHDQGAPVRASLEAAGFVAIDTFRDLAGHERVTCGRCPPQGPPV